MGFAVQTVGARVPFDTRIELAVTGYCAIVSQIVLMREFLVASYGNELSLGIMLALWLALTAAGSSLLSRLFLKLRPRRMFSVLLVAEALALYVAILVIRNSRIYWQVTPGEVLGPVPVFLIAFCGLALFCVISGALFTAGSHLYALDCRADSALGGSSMYLLEAAGSTVGGVLTSIVFLTFFSSLQIATIVAATNLLAATWIGVSQRAAKLVLSVVIVAAAILCLPIARRLEIGSVAKLWPGFRVLTTRTSMYGGLAVIESEGSRSLIQNGIVLFTAPDQALTEEAVHFPLLEHPSPRTVLLIGGGLNGSIAEILKHPTVERIDYVELDPAVIQLAQEYFANAWSGAADSRVHIHELDGRLFIRSSNQKFDVIILNLPEPQTGQINRFYTKEFFTEAASRLAPGGVLGFQVRASEEYLGPEMAEFLGCLKATVRSVFAEVVTIPGESVHFLSAQQPHTLSTDPQKLLARLRERGVHTTFIREYYLPYRMSQERISYLDEQLQPTPDTRVNLDFAPIAYFFEIELWSSQYSSRYRNLFGLAAGISARMIFGFASLLLVVMLAAFFHAGADTSRIHISIGFSVALMGLTTMAIQIVLLLGFQAVYGYVFHELAVITAGFMGGVAAGSALAIASRHSSRRSGSNSLSRNLLKLLTLQIAGTTILLVVVPVLAGMGRLSGHALSQPLLHAIFFGIALISGAIGGYQFPVAMRVFSAVHSERDRAAGVLYGLDLLGASLGALVISAYLLPVFGFFWTTGLVAFASLGSILMLAVSLIAVTSTVLQK